MFGANYSKLTTWGQGADSPSTTLSFCNEFPTQKEMVTLSSLFHQDFQKTAESSRMPPEGSWDWPPSQTMSAMGLARCNLNLRSWHCIHWSDESRFLLNVTNGRLRCEGIETQCIHPGTACQLFCREEAQSWCRCTSHMTASWTWSPYKEIWRSTSKLTMSCNQ